MQKSTDEQLDETVVGKIETTVPRTVRSIFFQRPESKCLEEIEKAKV